MDKGCVSILPKPQGNFIILDTLTGLRPIEVYWFVA